MMNSYGNSGRSGQQQPMYGQQTFNTPGANVSIGGMGQRPFAGQPPSMQNPGVGPGPFGRPFEVYTPPQPGEYLPGPGAGMQTAMPPSSAMPVDTYPGPNTFAPDQVVRPPGNAPQLPVSKMQLPGGAPQPIGPPGTAQVPGANAFSPQRQNMQAFALRGRGGRY